MDKQKPICFLFHCPVSCLFQAGQQLFSGLSLRYLCPWLSAGVDYSLNLFAFSLSDLLFLPLGFLTHSLIAYTPAIQLSCSVSSSTSHIPPFLSLFVWLLGYALLTHGDSSALWTPCLPTDDHMLPQHSSGKISFYSINFMISCLAALATYHLKFCLPASQKVKPNLNLRPVFSLMTLVFILTTVWQ